MVLVVMEKLLEREAVYNTDSPLQWSLCTVSVLYLVERLLQRAVTMGTLEWLTVVLLEDKPLTSVPSADIGEVSF